MFPPQPMGAPNPLMDLRARLRPMGIGDILDESFRLYRANFTLFVATVAIIEVPMQIIALLLQLAILLPAQALVPVSSQSGGITQAQLNSLADAAKADALFSFFSLLIAFITLILTSAALAVVISNRYLNRPITVGEAYRAVVDRLGPMVVSLLWWLVRIILLCIASIVLIGIPFLIYFGVAWSLVAQVVMLEGRSGTDATRRSRQLVQGFWWKACGLLLVTQLLIIVIGGIPSAVVSGIIGVTTGVATRAVITGIIGLIAGVLTQPIQAAAITLLFYDLKIRKEAFDLEAMVQQAGLAAPPPVAWQ